MLSEELSAEGRAGMCQNGKGRRERRGRGQKPIAVVLNVSMFDVKKGKGFKCYGERGKGEEKELARTLRGEVPAMTWDKCSRSKTVKDNSIQVPDEIFCCVRVSV